MTATTRSTTTARLCTPEHAARYRRRVDWNLHGSTPLPRPLFAGDTDCQGRTARLHFEDAHAVDCRVERTASRLYRLTSGAAAFVVQRAYPRVGEHPSQPAYVVRLLGASDSVTSADRRAALWTVSGLLDALPVVLGRVRPFGERGR